MQRNLSFFFFLADFFRWEIQFSFTGIFMVQEQVVVVIEGGKVGSLCRVQARQKAMNSVCFRWIVLHGMIEYDITFSSHHLNGHVHH